MTEAAYQRLPARLAMRLLELSNPDCMIPGPGQQALAGMLGTYRESVGARLRGSKSIVRIHGMRCCRAAMRHACSRLTSKSQ
jgi:hypothetical protein